MINSNIRPRYLSKKDRGGNSNRLIWRLIVIFLLIGGAGYIIIYSQIFQVKSVKVAGLENLSESAVLKIIRPLIFDSKLKKILGENNLFSWSNSSIDISGTELASAVIDRDWLSQAVNIEVVERKRLAIWCETVCYWIDDNGVTFAEAPETDGSLILKISVLGERITAVGKPVVEGRFIENLTEIIKGVLELRLPVQNAVYDVKLEELRISLRGGPEIYFSARFDPVLTLTSLIALMEQNDFSDLQYVDLRVENRIFYKK